MSDMKCPFCQQELDTGNYYVHCHNPHCNITVEMEGTEEMWLALIRTHKALELAITGLKNCKTRDHIGAVCRIPEYVDKILEQITTLEQKE